MFAKGRRNRRDGALLGVNHMPGRIDWKAIDREHCDAVFAFAPVERVSRYDPQPQTARHRLLDRLIAAEFEAHARAKASTPKMPIDRHPCARPRLAKNETLA